VAFHPEGAILASGGRDNTIRLWDVEQRKALAVLKGHQEVLELRHDERGVFALTFNHDGRLLASGGRDNTVRLWDVEQRREVALLQGHYVAGVGSVAFHPDGRLIVSTGRDGVRLWDVVLGRELTYFLDMNAGIFSPDGTLLVLGGSLDGTIHLWDLTRRQEVGVLQRPPFQASIPMLVFSPDGQILASAGWSTGTIHLWDWGQRKEAGLLDGHGGVISAVAFRPDGQILASIEGGTVEGGTVRLWDVVSRQPMVTMERGHTGWVTSLAFSPDGKLLASGGANVETTVRLWDLERRTERAVLLGHTGGISAVAFSPDGKLLASGGGYNDNTVRLWEVEQGREVAVFYGGYRNGVAGVAFSPDGETLVSAGDSAVHLWGVAERQIRGVLRGQTGLVQAVAVSPNDKNLLTVGGANGVSLWDIVRQEEVAVLPHPAGVTVLGFQPGGRLLASGGGYNEGVVHLWEVGERREVAVLPGAAVGLAFSPDGRILAVSEGEGAVHLWEVEERREVAVLRAYTALNRPVAFSPNGTLIAAGSTNGVIVLWGTLPPGGQPTMPTVEVLTVTPAQRVVLRGQTIRLTATITLADGTTSDVTQLAVWQSSYPGVATVSNLPGRRGEVTGIAPGEALITAQYRFLTSSPVRLIVQDVIPPVVPTPPPAGDTTGVGSPTRPTYHLFQNYPNPFNVATTIPYLLSAASEVTLIVYDVQGHRMRTLDVGRRAAGGHTVVWEGRDERERGVPSGIYLCRLQVGRTFVQTRKMVLIW
jgi:WD40 repeat protein